MRRSSSSSGGVLESGKVMFENLTPAEYQVLLRQDFVSFAARCFQDLNPQAELA